MKYLNDSPLDGETLLQQMDEMKKDDKDFRAGKTWNLVYHISDEFDEFVMKAHNKFFAENYLNPMAFKSIKQMEHEVVKMGAELLGGDDKTVGVVTSGGTESILLPCLAAREMAAKKKPWIVRPNIVVPESIHVAFDKACKLFGLKKIVVPLEKDYTVCPKRIAKAINRNTVMVAASAPQYVHGVIDPIEEIGKVCLKKKIPFHVDSCIGGFVLPFMKMLGEEVPAFDLSVPGVTSISADLHKYGYTPKGNSLLLYKDMEYMKHQFYICTNWSGGVYVSPNLPGSRPGAPVAAAWATMKYLGLEGYLEQTKKIIDTKKRLISGINEIADIEVVGNPNATLVCYKAKDNKKLPIFAVADQMEKKGWYADRHQKPESIHLTVMGTHFNCVEEFLDDLAEAVEIVKSNPSLGSQGDAAMYGLIAKVPLKGMINKTVSKVMEGLYGPDSEIPDLSNVASDESEDPIMAFVGKHQEKVMQALDKVNEVTEKVKDFRHRL